MSFEATKAKVQRILTDMLGSVTIHSSGAILLENDSAWGVVSVVDRGDGVTIVKVTSPILRNVRLTPEVFEWVATEGQESWFAHARIVDRDGMYGTISWEHDLLGNFLDPDELKLVFSAVMVLANEFDDELQARFGGDKGRD